MDDLSRCDMRIRRESELRYWWLKDYELSCEYIENEATVRHPN